MNPNKSELEKIKDDFYEYLLQDMSEMTNIRKKVTGLPMNLSMPIEDEDKKYPHNLPRIKFQNSSSDRIIASELIPVSITDNPQVLVNKSYNNDFYKATIDFIKANKDILLAFWKQKIDEEDLYRLLRERRNESLWEMAGVSQKRTGLNLYVYISPKQGSHGPGIKFVNGYERKMISSNLVPMTISDNPEIPTNVKLKVSSKDVEDLKKWVILNKDILLGLWNGDFDDEYDAIQLLKEI